MPGPTDLEQLALEYINDARLDPMGNAARYITSYTPPVSSDDDIQNAVDFFDVVGSALFSAFSALTPTQPVAWNENLADAARDHNDVMIANDAQAHVLPGEANIPTRITAAGYTGWSTLGENIFAYTQSAIHGHAGFMIDWGGPDNGMQSPPGHRLSIMSSSFREVGIGITEESNPSTGVGPLVMTQDFGNRFVLGPILLGVAYNDTDDDQFYSAGEGLGNLTVSVAGGGNVTTSASGGYSLETTTGNKTVTFSGGGLSGGVTVALALSAGQNVKFDIVDGNTLKTSSSASISGPVSTIVGLGTVGLTLTTTDAIAHTVIGGKGGDIITTGVGADTLLGGIGNDIVNGGAGSDWLYGGTGDDTAHVDTQADLVFENPGEGIDLVISSTSFYLYDNIENLTLASGAGNIFGSANALDNILTGNQGVNLLLGWDGNDTIYGGAGNDVIYGVNGSDVLYGEAGVDVLIAGESNDTLDGGNDPDELHGENGNDTLYGGTGFHTDIIVGGAGNDTLDGSASIASGQTRNEGDYDRLYGGTGDDTFHVDTPADLTFEFGNLAEGNDAVYADIVGGGYYLYGSVENLVLLDITPFGVGNELDNALTGSAITNWLLGGAGNDTINGKAGADVLFGEAGSDNFEFEAGTGGDLIGDFAKGSDKIRLMGTAFDSFAELTANNNLFENGGSSVINLGAGDFIVVSGVTGLTAGDLLFA